jgi:hypothetical protein
MGFEYGLTGAMAKLNAQLGTSMTIGNYWAGGQIFPINPASWGRPFRIGNIIADATENEDAAVFIAAIIMGGDPINQTVNTVAGKSLGMFSDNVFSFMNMSYLNFSNFGYNMLQRGLLSTSHLTTNERGFIGHFNSVYKSTKPIGIYPTLITSNDDGYERNHICFYSATALFDQSVIDIAPFIGMLIFDAQESRWKMYNGEEFVSTPQAGGTDKFFVPEFNKVIGWNPYPALPSNCEPFAVFLSMGQANGWIGSHLYMYMPQTQGFQDITPSVGMVVTEPTLGWTLICRAVGGESGTHAWEILNVKSVLDHLDTPPTLTSPQDDGKSYLIKAGAIGAWNEQDNNIAVWQNSGWAIIHRSIIGVGNAIYVVEDDLTFVWNGTVWENANNAIQDFITNNILHQASTAPVEPIQGQLYWDTDDETWYRWSGSAWIQVSGSGQAAGEINKYVLARQSTPPGSPTDGDRYIVKPTGDGAWSGHDNEITEYADSVWVFTPTALIIEGTSVYSAADTTLYTWSGSAWVKHDHDGVHADLVDGKVPINQLPDTIIGGMEYKGSHDCSGGAYPANPDQGDYYICSVAGSISGVNYQVGDWLVYNGSGWDKIDNTNDDAVLLTGNQTIEGIKTFSSIPVLPAADPESANQAARKSYVDGKISQTITENNTTTAPSEDAVFDGLAAKASAGHGHGNISTDGKIGASANLPLITSTDGVVFTGQFGTNANTFCQGNDSRLSDARTPTVHSEDKHSSINQNTIKGRISSGSGQVEDLTAENVRTLINVENGANNYSHPTSSGNKHVPTGGSTGQILEWDSDGNAQWATPEFAKSSLLFSKGTSFPTSPTPIEGQLFWHTTDEALYRYSGDAEAWIQVSGVDNAITQVEDDIAPALGGNLDAKNKKIVNLHAAEYDPTLSSDHTYYGNAAKLVVGVSVAFGNLLYYDATSGKWKKADADQASTMPGLAIALDDQVADEKCLCLMWGWIRDDSWETLELTDGGIIYVSTTEGSITTTPPSGSGDQVQAIGQMQGKRSGATYPSILYFCPDKTIIEVSS